MSLIAEDVLLLLLDDGSGKPIVDSTRLPRVLAGALLVELALSGAVSVAGEGSAVKPGRLVIESPTSPSPILAETLALVAGASRPMTPKKAIEKVHRGLQKRLAQSLVEQGFLDQRQGRVLGIFPTTTWPARTTEHEDALRAGLRSVLVDGRHPGPREAALISLLSAVDAVAKVLPSEDRKSVRTRAKDLAAGDWAAGAVKAAVSESVAAVNAAVLAAVIVPTLSTS